MWSRRAALTAWARTWLPVALGVAVICVESTPYMGSDHTSRILRPLWQFLFGPVRDPQWESIHHLIRKCGHFFGYGLLGLAWLRAWRVTLPSKPAVLWIGLAMLGTAAVASSDEFPQSFLPNRTASIWDVLIDCSGALTLQLAAFVAIRMLRSVQFKRA